MSSDDHNPLKMWALQIKSEIQKHRVREITSEVLFEALVMHDSDTVRDYYFKYNVPKDPEIRYHIDMRLETLRYISNSLTVN